MIKKLLILLPSLIQACLCLLPRSGLVLALSCILVLLQGGLCAWMAQPLWFSLLITLLGGIAGGRNAEHSYTLSADFESIGLFLY